MGLTPGEDFDTQFHCNACFPDGAPKFIKATVEGVISCPGIPENPNGSYVLIPNIVCRWRYYIGGLRLFWFAYHWNGIDFDSSFFIDYDPHPKHIFHSLGEPCQLFYENEYTVGDCVIRSTGYSGTVELSWGPGIEP